MSKKKNKKKQEVKERNWIAVAAHFHTGAGNHGDKRKKESKNKCRKKINLKDWGYQANLLPPSGQKKGA